MNMKWIGLAALVVALPVGAEMYKWMDADGKVHYSDRQPPTHAKRQETIRVSPRPNPIPAAPTPGATGVEGEQGAAPTGPKSVADQEMEFRKRRVEAAEAEAKRQKDAQAASDKQRNCEHAKARVAALEKGGRVTRLDASGEQVFLNDAEIGQALVEARKTADSWCS
ncbi:MAG TPA: DUF4124 domain-containing protein [Burkholderiales bacterium]|nr:DUF4124 domain-containing protein [Burkholderiales bacterium]